jgi:hypothetical protein
MVIGLLVWSQLIKEIEHDVWFTGVIIFGIIMGIGLIMCVFITLFEDTIDIVLKMYIYTWNIRVDNYRLDNARRQGALEALNNIRNSYHL